MQQFNVEVFAPDFTFHTHQQIESIEISDDYMSLDESTLTMWDDDQVKKGDYVHITGDIDYVVIISEVTRKRPNNKQMEVTVKPFLSLFNVPFLFDTDYQGSATSLEDFLKLTITALFINNTDTAQNITGLSVTTRSTTSGWGFHITSTEEGKHRAIINLYDSIITRALEKYQVTITPTFNFKNHTIALSIGTVSGSKTIEADLPNILGKAITETTSENDVNKLIVYDSAGYSQMITYYLHTDGTYDTTNSDRITPIVLDVEATQAEEGDTFANAAAKVASEKFAQKEYSDSIEIEVLRNDSLINPMSLNFGQIVTVISGGKSYTTILTGRTIAETVTLMLGIVRVDLTKKLGGVVNKVISDNPTIQQLRAAAIKQTACTLGNYENITSTQTAAPSDGYVFVYNDSSHSGYVQLGTLGNCAIGATNGRAMCFVRKGTKMQLSGSVNAARFIPLS